MLPEGYPRAVFEAIGDAVIVCDRDSTIVDINPAALEMLGYEEDDVVGRTCYEVLHGGRDETCRDSCSLKEALEGRTVRALHEHRKKGEKPRMVEITASPLRDGDGVVTHMVDVMRDVTTQQKVKETADLVHEINTMLNTGSEMDDVLMTIVDGLRSLYDYDSVAVHLMGDDRDHLTIMSYSADPAVTNSLERLVGSALKGYQAPLYPGSILREIVDTKRPVITDDVQWILKSYTENGPLRGLAGAASRLTRAKWGMGIPLLAGEEVIGVIGCGGTDELTDRDAEILARFGAQAGLAIQRDRRVRAIKEYAEELEETKAFLESIFNGIGEGVVVLDRDYNIISANRGYLRMTGRTMEEVLGSHCYEMSHRRQTPCSAAEHHCPVRETFETGRPSRAVHTHFDKDKNEMNVEVGSYPLRDPDGKVKYVIESVIDITEKRRLEEETLRAKDETIKEMKRHRDYVFEVADGLRNPLQVFIGHLEGFDTANLTREQRRRFDSILEASRLAEVNIKRLTELEENRP